MKFGNVIKKNLQKENISYNMPKRLPNPPYHIIDRGHTTPCWIWQGTERKGYGMAHNIEFKNGNGPKMIQAHVMMYEKLIGPRPIELVPDHLCRVRKCVNPDHIEWVKEVINIRRGQQAIINETLAYEIREKHKAGMRQMELARDYNISQATVSQIIRYVTWK